MEVKQMELEWKEPIQIPDGNQTGTIVKIAYRTDPYEYTDIIVKLDSQDVEMKYGCPTVLSENSKLGRLLKVFGIEAKAGTKIDPEKVLINQKVQFMTITKPNKDGKEFSEIVSDSLKPIAE
jgi:hypothetical protein